MTNSSQSQGDKWTQGAFGTAELLGISVRATGAPLPLGWLTGLPFSSRAGDAVFVP